MIYNLDTSPDRFHATAIIDEEDRDASRIVLTMGTHNQHIKAVTDMAVRMVIHVLDTDTNMGPSAIADFTSELDLLKDDLLGAYDLVTQTADWHGLSSVRELMIALYDGDKPVSPEGT
jgi:hypothetical protein